MQYILINFNLNKTQKIFTIKHIFNYINVGELEAFIVIQRGYIHKHNSLKPFLNVFYFILYINYFKYNVKIVKVPSFLCYLLILHRNASVQSPRVDPHPALQRPGSHSLVPRNPLVRHGLRRHPFRRRRSDTHG